MDSRDQLVEAGLCKCSLTDFLYDQHNEVFIEGRDTDRTQFKSPEQVSIKNKLSITNSIKMNEALSAKKAALLMDPCQTQREMTPNRISQFSLNTKEDKVSVSLRRRQSQNVVTPTKMQSIIRYPLIPKQLNTIHESIKAVPMTQHIYPQLHKQISLTSTLFTNYTTPKQSDHVNSRSTSETMLFTNYFLKSNIQENAGKPPLERRQTIDQTFSQCQIQSSTSKSQVGALPTVKPMKLKEVESQYAESTPGDQTNRSNRSRFVSKLERYIQQPNRPVESFIVKDAKKSGHSGNLQNTARFTKSVMAPNSRLKN